jgi:precorrin-6Y C5,15-methyltransferase (decarboxylating)
MSAPAVYVVGVADDGCRGLSSRAMDAIARASVLVGGERHLAFFPEFHGERITLRGDLSALLDRVAELAAEHTVCVLASGDPLFFGIGSRVVERIGREHVEVVPHPSSVQWAFARAGMRADDAAVISLHGRSLHGLVTRFRRVLKAALLTDKENTPARIAAHLLRYGERDGRAWVCENLCGPGERVRRFSLEELAQTHDVSPLNVVLLERTGTFCAPQVIGNLPEEAFAKRIPKKGLITKREVRVLSLAAMRLTPQSVVWDVGTASGSIAIEAGLIAYEGAVYAVEVDAESVDIARENALLHGADNVTVIHGRAPEALDGLAAPDAVFVGGSKGSMEEIMNVALDRLRPGGFLVVNAITLENAHESYAAAKARGLKPEITLVSTARAEPLAHYMRFEAMNPIQVLAVQKPLEPQEVSHG